MENERLSAANTYRKKISNGPTFKLFMFVKMPIAWLSGLKIISLDQNECTVSIPYKRLTQNPFRSVYFASQAMAAEMSTGVLAMAAIQGIRPSVSMLVANVEAAFHKKADSRIFFTCKDGATFMRTVDEAVQSGEGRTATGISEGFLADGTHVSTFKVTWTFKQKKSK
ncbi:MAG TPA: DUF4442 domain-containing protein [Chitinophagales bacterium]|nr:DUF4442 domain-containing protein [Chitinophagales bacterium]